MGKQQQEQQPQIAAQRFRSVFPKNFSCKTNS